MNNEVRKMMIEFKDRYGSPNTWFADKIGVSKVTISLFISGQRDLAENRLNKLIKIMNGGI